MKEASPGFPGATKIVGSTVSLVASALLLSACAVGPDFQRPAAPTLQTYDTADLPQAERVADSGSPVISGQEVPARWWTLFQSAVLEQTLRLVVENNNTLIAAKATLAQAQQVVIAAKGPLFPQVDLQAGAQRSGSGVLVPAGSGSASSLYSIGPTLNYTVDFFGLTRRTVEQQEALAENQQYQLAEAYLTLTGNAVTQAIAIAAARLEIATVEELIASDQQNLDLVRRKFEVGKAARTDILTAESQLLGDRSQISSLRQQLSVARHALAVLASRSSAEWTPPEFDIEGFTLPQEIPVNIPSALVRQRPDILAAEAQLHAASAAVGVATAQLYPTITLTGALTQQSMGVDTLFRGASTLWNFGGNLAVPVFHGGTLEAQRQAARDAFDAQYATYKQTVIVAFGQVADALRALDHDAEFIADARQSLRVSEESLALQRGSYDAGKTSLLDLIVAERAYAQARLSFAAAKIQQFQDIAQLFVVLGGGWLGADDVANIPHTDQ